MYRPTSYRRHNLLHWSTASFRMRSVIGAKRRWFCSVVKCGTDEYILSGETTLLALLA
jgi:hypothetical protein